MRRAVGAIGLVVCLALTGCGPSTPARVSRDLQARVSGVRGAVEEGRVFLARQRLVRLAAQVTELMNGGILDDGTGLEILDAIAEVRDSLALAPEPSPTVTETTAPPPTEDGGGHGDGKKDKGEGHGDEGHGKDD